MKGIRNLAVRVATCALVSLAVLASPGAPAAYATLNDASLVCAEGTESAYIGFPIDADGWFSLHSYRVDGGVGGRPVGSTARAPATGTTTRRSGPGSGGRSIAR